MLIWLHLMFAVDISAMAWVSSSFLGGSLFVVFVFFLSPFWGFPKNSFINGVCLATVSLAINCCYTGALLM